VHYRFSGARFRAAREAVGLAPDTVAALMWRWLTVVAFAEPDKHEHAIEKARALAAVGVGVDGAEAPVR
jgi:hypothetical protein